MTKIPELLELAIATAGGKELRDAVSGLKADVSINGPVWGLKGWPPGESFDQVLTIDTTREHDHRQRPHRPPRRPEAYRDAAASLRRGV